MGVKGCVGNHWPGMSVVVENRTDPENNRRNKLKQYVLGTLLGVAVAWNTAPGAPPSTEEAVREARQQRRPAKLQTQYLTGDIAAVDLASQTLILKGVESKDDAKQDALTFKTGGAKIRNGDKQDITLADLKVGKPVLVFYKKENGALIAENITLILRSFSGKVTAVDEAAQALTVKHPTKDESKTFKSAGAKISGAGIKVGDMVNVMYDEDDGALVAKSVGPPPQPKSPRIQPRRPIE